MNDFHGDEEVIRRIQQVEDAMNALVDLSRARGEYYVNKDGRYRFSWYS